MKVKVNKAIVNAILIACCLQFSSAFAQCEFCDPENSEEEKTPVESVKKD